MSALPPVALPGPAQPAMLARPSGSADMSRRTLRLVLTGVAGAHLLALWALLQVDSVRDAVREVAPMVVDLIAPPAPAPQTPPPPAPAALPRQPMPAPVLAAPSPAPVPAEAYSAPPPPEPVAMATPAPPAPPAPATTPSPKQSRSSTS